MKHSFFVFVCFIHQTCAMELKPVSEKDLIYNEVRKLFGTIDNDYAVKRLVGGLSSNSPYVCSVNGIKYVARTFRDAPEVRDIKVALNCLVAQKGIAPKIYYSAHHDNLSFIIMDFINTPTLSMEQANKFEILEKVGRKARVIADFDINMVTANKENILGETLRHHENIKKKKIAVFDPLLEELKSKIDVISQKIEHEKRPLVINHNDFYPRNMFYFDKDILVIDWETLASSYEFSDLACYSVCTCLDAMEDLYLLGHYLQRPSTTSDRRYFDLVKLLMRILVVVGPLNYANYIPENLSMESINNFKYYATAFAKDVNNDSPEFLYGFGMSQLRELRQEYEKFEKSTIQGKRND